MLKANPRFPVLPPTCPAVISSLVTRCLNREPKARPPMQQVVVELTAAITALSPALLPQDKPLQRPADEGARSSGQGPGAQLHGLSASALAGPGVKEVTGSSTGDGPASVQGSVAGLHLLLRSLAETSNPEALSSISSLQGSLTTSQPSQPPMLLTAQIEGSCDAA